MAFLWKEGSLNTKFLMAMMLTTCGSFLFLKVKAAFQASSW